MLMVMFLHRISFVDFVFKGLKMVILVLMTKNGVEGQKDSETMDCKAVQTLKNLSTFDQLSS